MTTIRDLMNDFAEDIKDAALREDSEHTFDEEKSDLLDQYTITIKERIVG